MTRILIILISILLNNLLKGQTKFGEHLSNIEGVWIEAGFQAMFDSLSSMALISQSMETQILAAQPIGLRINSREVQNDNINIGYGVLHSHGFYPEVSTFCIQNNDTLYEQGHFVMNLNSIDSLGYYKIADLFTDYDLSAICLLSINYASDTTIQILRFATDHLPEIKLTYTKYRNEFADNYLYPNPRDLYIRSETLAGKYTLLDSSNVVITNEFEILENGQMLGFMLWETQKIQYSTDVFCGGPAKFDVVLIYDPNGISDSEVVMLYYTRPNEKTIQFFTKINDGSKSNLNKPTFTLIKNN